MSKRHVSLHVAYYLVVVFFITFIFGYIYREKLKTDVLNLFESKTLAQLETYHNTNLNSVNIFVDDTLKTVINISQNQKLRLALLSNNLAYVQDFFDNELQSRDYVDMWSVFDSRGNMIVNSARRPGFANTVGKSFADRDYFRQVTKTKKPYMSIALKGVVTGTNIIVFSAPLVDGNNNILYVVNCSIPLAALQKQLGLQGNLTKNSNVLLDREGNILLENGVTFKDFSQYKDSFKNDRVIQSLMQGRKHDAEDEINYRGEVVFAMGDQLSNNLFLVSYYPRIQYEEEYQGIKAKILRYYVFSLVIFTVLALIVYKFHNSS